MSCSNRKQKESFWGKKLNQVGSATKLFLKGNKKPPKDPTEQLECLKKALECLTCKETELTQQQECDGLDFAETPSQVEALLQNVKSDDIICYSDGKNSLIYCPSDKAIVIQNPECARCPGVPDCKDGREHEKRDDCDDKARAREKGKLREKEKCRGEEREKDRKRRRPRDSESPDVSPRVSPERSGKRRSGEPKHRKSEIRRDVDDAHPGREIRYRSKDRADGRRQKERGELDGSHLPERRRRRSNSESEDRDGAFLDEDSENTRGSRGAEGRYSSKERRRKGDVDSPLRSRTSRRHDDEDSLEDDRSRRSSQRSQGPEGQRSSLKPALTRRSNLKRNSPAQPEPQCSLTAKSGLELCVEATRKSNLKANPQEVRPDQGCGPCQWSGQPQAPAGPLPPPGLQYGCVIPEETPEQLYACQASMSSPCVPREFCMMQKEPAGPTSVRFQDCDPRSSFERPRRMPPGGYMEPLPENGPMPDPNARPYFSPPTQPVRPTLMPSILRNPGGAGPSPCGSTSPRPALIPHPGDSSPQTFKPTGPSRHILLPSEENIHHQSYPDVCCGHPNVCPGGGGGMPPCQSLCFCDPCSGNPCCTTGHVNTSGIENKENALPDHHHHYLDPATIFYCAACCDPEYYESGEHMHETPSPMCSYHRHLCQKQKMALAETTAKLPDDHEHKHAHDSCHTAAPPSQSPCKFRDVTSISRFDVERQRSVSCPKSPLPIGRPLRPHLSFHGLSPSQLQHPVDPEILNLLYKHETDCQMPAYYDAARYSVPGTSSPLNPGYRDAARYPVPQASPYSAYCGTGRRSMSRTSITSQGYQNVHRGSVSEAVSSPAYYGSARCSTSPPKGLSSPPVYQDGRCSVRDIPPPQAYYDRDRCSTPRSAAPSPSPEYLESARFSGPRMSVLSLNPTYFDPARCSVSRTSMPLPSPVYYDTVRRSVPGTPPSPVFSDHSPPYYGTPRCPVSETPPSSVFYDTMRRTAPTSSQAYKNPVGCPTPQCPPSQATPPTPQCLDPCRYRVQGPMTPSYNQTYTSTAGYAVPGNGLSPGIIDPGRCTIPRTPAPSCDPAYYDAARYPATAAPPAPAFSNVATCSNYETPAGTSIGSTCCDTARYPAPGISAPSLTVSSASCPSSPSTASSCDQAHRSKSSKSGKSKKWTLKNLCLRAKLKTGSKDYYRNRRLPPESELMVTNPSFAESINPHCGQTRLECDTRSSGSTIADGINQKSLHCIHQQRLSHRPDSEAASTCSSTSSATCTISQESRQPGSEEYADCSESCSSCSADKNWLKKVIQKVSICPSFKHVPRKLRGLADCPTCVEVNRAFENCRSKTHERSLPVRFKTSEGCGICSNEEFQNLKGFPGCLVYTELPKQSIIAHPEIYKRSAVRSEPELPLGKLRGDADCPLRPTPPMKCLHTSRETSRRSVVCSDDESPPRKLRNLADCRPRNRKKNSTACPKISSRLYVCRDEKSPPHKFRGLSDCLVCPEKSMKCVTPCQEDSGKSLVCSKHDLPSRKLRGLSDCPVCPEEPKKSVPASPRRSVRAVVCRNAKTPLGTSQSLENCPVCPEEPKNCNQANPPTCNRSPECSEEDLIPRKLRGLLDCLVGTGSSKKCVIASPKTSRMSPDCKDEETPPRNFRGPSNCPTYLEQPTESILASPKTSGRSFTCDYDKPSPENNNGRADSPMCTELPTGSASSNQRLSRRSVLCSDEDTSRQTSRDHSDHQETPRNWNVTSPEISKRSVYDCPDVARRSPSASREPKDDSVTSIPEWFDKNATCSPPESASPGSYSPEPCGTPVSRIPPDTAISRIPPERPPTHDPEMLATRVSNTSEQAGRSTTRSLERVGRPIPRSLERLEAPILNSSGQTTRPTSRSLEQVRGPAPRSLERFETAILCDPERSGGPTFSCQGVKRATVPPRMEWSTNPATRDPSQSNYLNIPLPKWCAESGTQSLDLPKRPTSSCPEPLDKPVSYYPDMSGTPSSHGIGQFNRHASCGQESTETSNFDQAGMRDLPGHLRPGMLQRPGNQIIPPDRDRSESFNKPSHHSTEQPDRIIPQCLVQSNRSTSSNTQQPEMLEPRRSKVCERLVPRESAHVESRSNHSSRMSENNLPCGPDLPVNPFTESIELLERLRARSSGMSGKSIPGGPEMPSMSVSATRMPLLPVSSPAGNNMSLNREVLAKKSRHKDSYTDQYPEPSPSAHEARVSTDKRMAEARSTFYKYLSLENAERCRRRAQQDKGIPASYLPTGPASVRQSKRSSRPKSSSMRRTIHSTKPILSLKDPELDDRSCIRVETNENTSGGPATMGQSGTAVPDIDGVPIIDCFGPQFNSGGAPSKKRKVRDTEQKYSERSRSSSRRERSQCQREEKRSVREQKEDWRSEQSESERVRGGERKESDGCGKDNWVNSIKRSLSRLSAKGFWPDEQSGLS